MPNWTERRAPTAGGGERPESLDPLIARTYERLCLLAGRMLRQSAPGHPRAQLEAALHAARARLAAQLAHCLSLPARHFWNLAAEQVRQELVRINRHFQRSEPADEDGGLPVEEAAIDQLHSWVDFYRAIQELPGAEREVYSLLRDRDLLSDDAPDLLAVKKVTDTDKIVRSEFPASTRVAAPS